MRTVTPRRTFAASISFLALLLAVFSAQATQPKEIVVFGESNSDVGNYYILSGSPADYAWFTDGRIGNGPQWTDYLASYYKHVPGMSPSLAGGSGYATAGADTSYGAGCNGLGSTGQQVMEYLSAYPQISGTGNKLFVIWGGANDIVFCGETDMAVPVGNIVSQIGMLFDAGGRQFLVLNMIPIGHTPLGLAGTGSPNEEWTESVEAFNDELPAQLTAFKCDNPAAHIYAMDVHQMFMDVLADPESYGYLNITDGAFDVGGDPDTHLWWDFAHTTTGFNALIAEEAQHLLSHHRGGLRCNAK